MKHAPQECWENAKRLVLTLAKDTQQVYVLYGSLDLDVPGIGPVRLQQQLTTEKNAFGTCAATDGHPCNRHAHCFSANTALGRFGKGRYRVFYYDRVQAIKWFEPCRSTKGSHLIGWAVCPLKQTFEKPHRPAAMDRTRPYTLLGRLVFHSTFAKRAYWRCQRLS